MAEGGLRRSIDNRRSCFEAGTIKNGVQRNEGFRVHAVLLKRLASVPQVGGIFHAFP